MRCSRLVFAIFPVVAVLVGACSRGGLDSPDAVVEKKTVEPIRLAVLEDARLPVDRIERDASRIAFLPMQNQGNRVLHSMLLDGPGETLAVFAGLRTALAVVRPDVVARILREAGRPDWFAMPTSFRYDPPLLERVADLTGAGILVWTEIDAQDAITLHSRAMTPGADAERWNGVRITREAEGSIDRFVHDAPRRLLDALDARFAEQTAVPVAGHDPSVLESGLAAARTEMWSGHSGPIRHAEQQLAELALAFPNRPEPWIDLAFLRVLRWMVLGDEFRTDLMFDGVNVARHFARRFENLDESQRARLDFVDYAYVGEGDSQETYLAFIAGLPAGAPERVLLAWLQEWEPKSRFAAPVDALPGDAGWALSKLVPIRGRDAQRQWVWELLHDQATRDSVLVSPLLLHHARRQADTLNNWQVATVTRRMDLPHAAAEGLETWRSRCLSLHGPHRASCAAAVQDWIRIFDPAVAVNVEALADDDFWAETESRLFLPFAEAKLPADVAQSLAPDSIQRRDASFGGLVHMLERFIATSNRIAALVDDAGPVLDTTTELLTLEARRSLGNDVDLILSVAEQPREIGKARGQRKEWEPYADVLDAYPDFPFFRDVMEMGAWIDQREKGRLSPDRLTYLLGEHHPYEMSYVSQEHRQLGQSGRLVRADELARLVPAMGRLVAESHNLRRKSGQPERALAGLEQQMAYRPDRFAVEVRDKAMVDLKRSKAERLAALLAGEKDFPRGPGLNERIVKLALDEGDYAVARERYEGMRDEATSFTSGCIGLVEIARREGDRGRAEAIQLDCAQRSENNFASANAWNDVATRRRDEGRLAEALEAVLAGEKRVGGASFILLGEAYIRELMGDYEGAERVYRSNDEIYEKTAEGRIGVAIMALRRNRPAEAIEVVKAAARDESVHFYNLSDTARLSYLAAGDMAGFRAFAPTLGQAGLISLAEAEWDVSHDLARATALLDQANEPAYDCACLALARARILREAGKPKEALAAAVIALRQEDSDRTQEELVLAKIAAGEIGSVRAMADAADPWNVESWFIRAAADITEGKPEDARKKIGWASKRLYPAQPSGKVGWAWNLRPLLLLETTLVGSAGERSDDERLAHDLEFAANQLAYDARLWEALARVRRQLGDSEAAASAEAHMLALWPHRAERPVAATEVAPSAGESASASVD